MLESKNTSEDNDSNNRNVIDEKQEDDANLENAYFFVSHVLG